MIRLAAATIAPSHCDAFKAETAKCKQYIEDEHAVSLPLLPRPVTLHRLTAAAVLQCYTVPAFDRRRDNVWDDALSNGCWMPMHFPQYGV